MNETSDKLPTGEHNNPTNSGDVSDFVLSPRFSAKRGEARTVKGISPFQGGQEGTNEPLESSVRQTKHSETSDRLPTEASKTSDTTERYRAFEHYLDGKLDQLLLQLSTCSQVHAAGTTREAADANAVRMPVTESGKAITDDPVGNYSRDYENAERIVELKKRVHAKAQIVHDADLELRLTRRARRKAVDLGVQEGRLIVGRFAKTHGTRAAAIAFCLDPNDPKSVERMQRNARNYIAEVDRVEKTK